MVPTTRNLTAPPTPERKPSYRLNQCWHIINWTLGNIFQWNCIQNKNTFIKKMHLTHWDPVTHICISNLTIIGSDNGLSPGRRQAITWTNVGILLIGPLGTNFSEMLIQIHTLSFKKIHLKMSSGKWRPFCLSLNVLKLSSAKWRPFCSGFTLLTDSKQPSQPATKIGCQSVIQLLASPYSIELVNHT